MAILLAALLVLPLKVGATTTTGSSSMTVTVGTTNNAKAGDTVTVRLVGSNNPGISTFGVQLGYNQDYLTYTGAYTWSNTITSNGIEMVNASTEDSNPVVNISAVFSNTYSSNETIITLNFTVKRDYTDMSTYLSPAVREVTDSGMNNVTVNWVYDPNAGLSTESQKSTSSQNLIQDSSQNTSQSTGSTGSGTGTNNSGTGSNGNTVDDGSGTGTAAGVTNNYYNTTKSTSSNKNGVDNTPKTGAINLRTVLVMVIVAFIAIAGVCLRILGKRKRI
jgi:hypothetical protein